MKKYTKEIEDFEDEDFEDKEIKRIKIFNKALSELKEKIRDMQDLSLSDERIAQCLDIPEAQVKELGNQTIENNMTLTEKTIHERDQLIASMEKEDISEAQAKILEHKVDRLNHILSQLELAKHLLKEGLGIEITMQATDLTEEAVKRLKREINQS
ncbi:MAG: hypothetical protein ATN31_10275 [Candidatus Epulonipiscioides saccharophilum]|nr:MAG: hypothetical protein ATN31_10275 [Epulopiscium sp. AS2M-Bin001]